MSDTSNFITRVGEKLQHNINCVDGADLVRCFTLHTPSLSYFQYHTLNGLKADGLTVVKKYITLQK